MPPKKVGFHEDLMKEILEVENAEPTKLEELVESSDESEDEEVPVKERIVALNQGKISEADVLLENEFEYEIEEISKILITSSSEDPTSEYIRQLQIFSSFDNARFQDILPQIVDGRKFVIDGDSLLMHALNCKGLSIELGVPTLHVIYIVENFLQIFTTRALNFVVVFFEIWDKVWSQFSQIAVVRNALKLHFLHNQTKFDVFSTESLWSEHFYHYLSELRPGFIMMSFEIPQFIQSLKLNDEKISLKWIKYILSAQSAHCEFICLDVVDIDTVFSSSVCLMATVHVHFNNLNQFKEQITEIIKTVETSIPDLSEVHNIEMFPEKDVRSSLVILAASLLLNKDPSEDVRTVIKVVLLSLVLKERLPLKSRCFKNLPEVPHTVVNILHDFQKEIAKVISHLSTNKDLSHAIDFRFVGDIWQGNFMKAVFCSVAESGTIENGGLNRNIADRYEELISHVNKFTDIKDFEAYPIKSSCEDVSPEQHINNSSILPPLDFGSKKLLPSSCKLLTMFCGELCSKLDCDNMNTSEDSSEYDYLQEDSHWQNLTPLTDEYERIPDDSNNDKKFTVDKKYSQNARNAFARYQTIYGMSLEGRKSVNTIVTNVNEKTSGSKKTSDKPKIQSKNTKQMSKKDKIIEENNKRMMSAKQKQLKERFKSFSNNFSSLIQKSDFSGAIELCDMELQAAASFKEIVLDILFQKAKACFNLWTDECHKKSTNRNYFGAKQLFLVIKEILKITQDNNICLDSKQKIILSDFLHCLGHKELAKIKEFPEPSKTFPPSYQVGFNHVEFQLAQLGAELERDTGGKSDSRVSGFIPDPWQVELFDIIDKRQSALVVAPTSSGKTYASYYCMEQVIRESNDGVVVYVCPTKALVNQVYATVYARYKKNLPAGKVLLGVFTQDYRQNVTNCQILITIPKCMELLLLSPRCQTWISRIKYVIFDEVHCLVGHSGGLAWENSLLLVQCPFLALSATIHKPELFCAWLQKIESFKKLQAEKFNLVNRSPSSYRVTLVVHSDRHNHLLKNVMLEDGSIEHVHPYSFLNLTSADDYRGIANHIVLSPDEVFELYNAMKKVLINSENIKNFDIMKYFKNLCPSGFLSMQSVQKFCVELRSVLEKETLSDQLKVLDCLKKVDYGDLKTGEEYVYRNIPLVLDALKQKDMLPALVFTYNRALVEALPLKVLRYLRDLDNFTEDEETDIESADEDTNDKKGNKTNRRFKGKKYKRKLAIVRGPSILKSEGSLRGEGFSDEKVIEFIEKRLIKMGYKAQDSFPSMLRRGVGKHFAGMNNRERSAVEMLFRLKILNLVTSTETLALGIHMPCKSVVVAGDSPFLNVLEFNQMSGRAGRRGFDKEGNVIFFGMDKRKMESLMTGNLPQMVGNFPLSVSLILRLLSLAGEANSNEKESEEVTNQAMAKIYTLLENSLLYQTQDYLKNKLKYFFSFSVQFLMRLGLLNKEGQTHTDVKLVTHLHDHEPGNFAFYFLLRSGVLEKLCKRDKNSAITEDSLENLVIVFSFLFARLPLSEHLLKKEEKIASVVLLPPLPNPIHEALKDYNRMTLNVFSHFFSCVTDDIKNKYGDETLLPVSQLKIQSDNILPAETLEKENVLSKLNKLHTTSNVCSVFAGLSGNSDHDLFPLSGDLNHIRGDLNVKTVPTLELDFRSNSYALDFYKHGNRKAICYDNGLKSGHDFTLLRDFLLVLKSIHTSLAEKYPYTKLYEAVDIIFNRFEANFNRTNNGYQGK